MAASEKPEAVTAAVAAYRLAQPDGAEAVAEMQRELAALDAALKKLADEEAATVQAQIAGLMAGASAGAYAEAFSAIAVRRKDMQDRRGVLSQSVTRVTGAKPQGQQAEDLTPTILADVLEALTSEELEGVEKRNLVGRVVDKVICHKDGAEVVFAPGVFGADIQDTLQTALTTSYHSVGERSIRPRPQSAIGARAE